MTEAFAAKREGEWREPDERRVTSDAPQGAAGPVGLVATEPGHPPLVGGRGSGWRREPETKASGRIP